MMKSFPILGVILPLSFSLSAQPVAEGTRFVIDNERSSMTVKVGKAGFFRVFGHEHLIDVREMSGHVDWSEDDPGASSVQLEIEAASLRVIDEKVKDEERREIQGVMEGEVLEVELHPKIRFVSSDFRVDESGGPEYEATVSGVLSLHGVTRTMDVTLRLTASENEIHARGELELQGSRFEVEQVVVAGGSVKTKDELEIQFDLVASR